MRVSIVGLGPGPADWVTGAAIARLHLPGAGVFFRTRLWPGLGELMHGRAWESFDELYERAASLEDVHTAMAERLLDAGAEVVLGVPGDGALGEAVLDRLRAGGAVVEIVPGIPLGVAAIAAAGVPAADGAQVVEATALGGGGLDLLVELNPRWPAVVTGVFNSRIASDVKLALQRVYPPEHNLVVVHHPGLADAWVQGATLAEVDRARVDFDHLTHVVVPPAVGYAPTGSAHSLRAIVARLRAPAIGCPWDLEQTHSSLIPYVIEEAYEVVDAIEADDPVGLCDELGDLLLQVALHAEVADQASEFEWNDVVRTLSEKLVRRHPHVFGSVQVTGASEVVRNWDRIKQAERVDQPAAISALDGVPKSLPQLKRAGELARKAGKAGFDWPTREGTVDKVREELAELLAANSLAERREELGDLLWILAKLAWQDGIDPEEALRAANRKFSTRFAVLEQIAAECNWPSLGGRPLVDLQSAWAEAKRRTGHK
ncbi:MAG TPA: nucleoside triphosphate pyrophosphohydrolase [Chloroflexota bacterium]|nr:nucleoside triphosphate pyrophosphohydrolase [Chloroflexota bacterium]